MSIFRPARAGAIVFQSAFGISQPEPFGRPAAMGIDSDGRIYIANAQTDGQVRAFDRRGRFISPVGGQPVRAPRGVAVDRFDRVAIADSGNERLLIYGSLQAGAPLLDSYPLAGPGPVAFAPGALLYTLAGGRVVRLRFDDADRDGVADQGDNCLGLANGNQNNADKDDRGDACDDDDDADGKLDAADKCPTEASLLADDPDGCRDPRTRFLVPQHQRRYPVSPSRLTGNANGGDLGIAHVQVALGRRLDARSPLAAGARCSWLDPAKRAFVTSPCRQPVWFDADGGASWRVRLNPGLLASGNYAAMARARQNDGPWKRASYSGATSECSRSPRR